MRLAYDSRYKLNAICPYFTMFPLEFPLHFLVHARRGSIVADPYCGRGTTNYAARVRGFESFGIDSSPVAVAIARAKLAETTVERVLRLAQHYLEEIDEYEIPRGEFWCSAYHSSTLHEICRIRQGLLNARHNEDAVMLRALMLGCLHGPLPKNLSNAGYFSNQMPRTYGSKPDYSVGYWRVRHLSPPKVSVLGPLRRKAERVLAHQRPTTSAVTAIVHGDSRLQSAYRRVAKRITHVVTSPPYYGLRTYVEDQWLRNWFLGGPAVVPYGEAVQVSHRSTDDFIASLAAVWNKIGDHASPELKMAVRFGAIGSYRLDPREIVAASLDLSLYDWSIYRTKSAGSARKGKRQADLMVTDSKSLTEYDVFVHFK